MVLWVAYYQIKALRDSQSAEFLRSLSQDFFTSETIKLITVFHSNAIEFDANNNAPIFRVDVEKLEMLYPNRNWAEKLYYTTYEIDCMLLNYLDDVGNLEQEKIIKLHSTHQAFGWYVNILNENEAIKSYIKWIKDEEDNEYVFDKLRQINMKFNKLKQNKLKK